MHRHAFAMGQAGTGKTTWLIQQIQAVGPQILVTEHQRLLALSFMHGARRRLDAAICDACPGLRFTATTIDGFALSILNRWRTALQFHKVVVGCQGDFNFEDHEYSIRAGFDNILKVATQLLCSANVAKFVSCSYPLIAIDEFQDCHGERLEFVKRLGQCSRLLVAADEFQLLDASVQGCPAVEWARQLNHGGHVDVHDLTTIHRTNDATILETARSLRSGTGAGSTAVKVQCFNGKGEAAFRILEAIYWKHPTGAPFGNRAIISPSRSPILEDILNSFEQQCIKRSLKPLRWRKESNEGDAVIRVMNQLDGNGGMPLKTSTLAGLDCTDDPVLSAVRSGLIRLSRLKGLSEISVGLVKETVERTVHRLRAFGPGSISSVVTTVHGAKNREFDDVFVIWPFQVAPGPELQRRLLYNAVTRARRRCILLIQGGVRRAKKEFVLQLLGDPVPVFPAKKKQPKAKPGGKKSV